MIRGSRKIARRYAKALLMVVREEGRVSAQAKELNRLGQLLEREKELQEFLTNPAFEPEERLNVLEQVIAPLGLHATTQRFLHLLIEKDRIAFLFDLILAYQELADEAENRLRARVISARELPEQAAQELRATLAQLTGKEVLTEFDVEPSLLGGLVIKIGSMVIDGSVKSQLDSIRETLAKGGLA